MSGYNTYKNLQEFLFQAIKGHDFELELQYISRFYGDDINKANLKYQLQTFALDYPIKNTQPNVFKIREYADYVFEIRNIFLQQRNS